MFMVNVALENEVNTLIRNVGTTQPTTHHITSQDTGFLDFTTTRTSKLETVWSDHSSLLGCDEEWCRVNPETFRRNVCRAQYGGSTSLRNADKLLPGHNTSHTRRE
jgi:hypothetical protein